MKISSIFLLITCFASNIYSQNLGTFPAIKKESLLRDLDILHQGLDQFHSGMYWYTPKDSIDFAFEKAKGEF